jgi:hypothetical protein
METRTYAGIIVGVAFGLVVAWGAMFPALSAGGLVLLAATVDGIMAGIGGGGLIGLTVAIGTFSEEEEEARVHAVPPELPKAA